MSMDLEVWSTREFNFPAHRPVFRRSLCNSQWCKDQSLTELKYSPFFGRRRRAAPERTGNSHRRELVAG